MNFIYFFFQRLDGSMNLKEREKAIKEFSSNSSIIVFLISLRAGGVGLNLIAANHVFISDPWW